MAKKKNIEAEQNRDDVYSTENTQKHSVMAYIICVVAAVLIWLLIMNLNQPVNIPLSTSADIPANLLWV
jgi:uncharacterized membrane-anchored protein